MKTETLRVRNVVDATRFGCMVASRGGYRMARGWHYAKLSLSQALYRWTLGSERHLYAVALSDELGTDPMAHGGLNK